MTNRFTEKKTTFNWMKFVVMLATVAAVIFAWRANSIANSAKKESKDAIKLSYESNDIAREANRISSRTYLAVSPLLFPFGSLEGAEEIGKLVTQLGEDRYIALAGDSDGIKAWLSFIITNQGNHEAKDVQLSFDFRLGHKDLQKQLIKVTKLFKLGDLPPGASIPHHIDITLLASDIPIDKSFWTNTQQAYERDIVRVKVSAEASYKSITGERLSSGKFVGETRRGGAFLGTVDEDIIPWDKAN